MAVLRTDTEPVLLSKMWNAFCKDEGIEREPSPQYRKELNGVAESAVRMVGVSTRTMMIAGSAPEREFEFAIRHAVFILNDSITSANNGETRNARWAGVKNLAPSRRIMKAVIFCLAYPMIYKE